MSTSTSIASSSSSSSSSPPSPLPSLASLALSASPFTRPISKTLYHALEAKETNNANQVWRLFLWLCEKTRVPHKLNDVRNALKQFGEALHFHTTVDNAGNVLIRRPASPRFVKSASIVVQSHMDMVCSSHNNHDFDNMPINPTINKDWMSAEGTTLGADDGIGVAASLALLCDDSLECGQIEALFTADEETTMGGAEFIDPAPFVQSKILINVDSEEPDSICVGCAGGFERQLKLPVTYVDSASLHSESLTTLTVNVHSLRGGHTGIDIAKGRANAIIVLARLLAHVLNESPVSTPSTSLSSSSSSSSSALPLFVSSLSGGNAANAIPRDARATILVPTSVRAAVVDRIQTYFKIIQEEYIIVETADRGESEPADDADHVKGEKVGTSSMKLNVTESGDAVNSALTLKQSLKVLDFMLVVPHGPLQMSPILVGEVDTSISFSLTGLSPSSSELSCHVFCRSSSFLSMNVVSSQLSSICRLVDGANITGTFGVFPGWKPATRSGQPSLALQSLLDAYDELNQNHKEKAKPRVYSVHAGLECGLIMGKYPDLDCVSIGPLIEHAHSPEERLQISSVKPFYDWLRATILRIAHKTNN